MNNKGGFFPSCSLRRCSLSPLAGRRRNWRWAWRWGADYQTRRSSWGSCRRSRALGSSCSGRWRASLARTFWLAPCVSSSMTPSCSPYPRCSGETTRATAPIPLTAHAERRLAACSCHLSVCEDIKSIVNPKLKFDPFMSHCHVNSSTGDVF